jgi:2,7-dihydroxy-5-methyl-1-naphthoate 7-O-methyltransferase
MASGTPAGGNPGKRLDQLTDLATPFAVRTAVALRVPDQIASGRGNLRDLATACGADPGALGRLVRYLVHQGVFAEVSPEVFALTEVGELLADRSAGGRAAYLDLDGLPARMDLAFAGLPHAIRTGEPGYASVYGRDLWADLDAQPEFRTYFDDLMRSQQLSTAPQVAALYPWQEVGHIVDVGGGSGWLLAEVLTAHPHLRGTLVDQAEPTAAAERTFADRGLAGRAGVAAGDFFQPLPAGAEVYVLSRVLTDWDDSHATAILRRCAEAAGSADPAGRVLVAEVLPTQPHVPHLSSYDLKMLVVVGGRERATGDFAALAAAAGLALARTYSGQGGLTLLELEPTPGRNRRP